MNESCEDELNHGLPVAKWPGWVDRLLVGTEAKFAWKDGAMRVYTLSPRLGDYAWGGQIVDADMTRRQEILFIDKLFDRLAHHVWENFEPDGTRIQAPREPSGGTPT